MSSPGSGAEEVCERLVRSRGPVSPSRRHRLSELPIVVCEKAQPRGDVGDSMAGWHPVMEQTPAVDRQAGVGVRHEDLRSREGRGTSRGRGPARVNPVGEVPTDSG